MGLRPAPEGIAEAFDALGRRVAVLFDGPAADAVSLVLDGARLAPSAYVVRVTTVRGVLTRVVVRAGR